MISDLIRSMSEAGAPVEAIILAVEAVEKGQHADAERRAKQVERTARCRARKRDGHVTVTRQSRDPSPSPSSPPRPPSPPTPPPVVIPPLPSEAAPKGASRSQGTTLPDDWQPQERHFAKAAEHGLGSAWVHDRADAMREWAAANRNRAIARKANWDAAFDGFIRRDLPKARASPRPPQNNPRLQAANDLMAYIAEHRSD